MIHYRSGRELTPHSPDLARSGPFGSRTGARNAEPTRPISNLFERFLVVGVVSFRRFEISRLLFDAVVSVCAYFSLLSRGSAAGMQTFHRAGDS